ncbi:MAG: hypothetical protein CMB54_02705, partial [Euryarchaeota archaeon]|nr:hypothetical protein [Euryarchaeota archaeon]
MKFRIGLFTVLFLLIIYTMSPILVSADSESQSIVRQRASYHTFFWDGSANTVEVMGEWDGWTNGTPMVEVSTNQWSANIEVDPGMYCYKFVVDGNWIIDPSNPYRGYCDSFENSIARVANETRPMFTHSIENETLYVYWHAGSGGEAPSSTPIGLLGSTWDAQNWTWSLDLGGLEDGKHTIHIEGFDTSGIPADDLLLPFWIGEESDFIWNDALIYMVMTDRFVNGNQSNDPTEIQGVAQGADWMGGDLSGVTSMIESGYFSDLGVNALWLTPFNEAANGTGLAADGVHEVSAYHGYWPVEPRSIDPRLGTSEELHELVDSAHAAGIRVMGDFVVNHVHEDHPYHIDHPEWFNEGCICGEENCDWTEHRLDCLFRDYMPDLNWKDRNASEQMIEDVLWWIETYDLDGGRIDAVKHVDDLAITNLAVRINERFETAGTDIYLKGETAMGWSGHNLESNSEQYGTINRYMGPNSLDGQADFVLYHATSDLVFATGQEDYMHLDYWTARSQDQYSDGSVMVPFVGSHDTSRFSSRSDPGTADEWNQWVEQGLPGQPGTDDPYRASLQAHGWLLTTPGAPMIYMGDEYGEYGGADPDNRHMWRNSQSQNERERGLQENISQLGVLRSELESLRRGGYQSIFNSSDIVVYQRSIGLDSSLIALNRGGTSTSIDIGSGFNDHSTVFGSGWIENNSNLLHISQHSVTVLTNESSYFESNITSPEREPDGHCLILQNLTVNESLYVALELTNICDKGINYPGVNVTVDNSLVEGFPGMLEWYYFIFANSTYNYSWQLILNETIPNGTEVLITFEAEILSCGDSDLFFHHCPNSRLTYSLIVEWPEP